MDKRKRFYPHPRPLPQRERGLTAVPGFTLIELMLVMLIFTIVTGAAYALMNSGRTGWHSGTAKIELQDDTRRAMGIMAHELSESASDRVTIGGAGTFITFQVPVDENAQGSWEDTDSDGTNDFYLEDTLDASGNIEWGAYLRQEDRTVSSSSLLFGPRIGRSVRFLLIGDELTRRILDSAGSVIEDFALADNIQNISFTNSSQSLISISMNAQKLTIERHPVAYSLATAVSLRD